MPLIQQMSTADVRALALDTDIRLIRDAAYEELSRRKLEIEVLNGHKDASRLPDYDPGAEDDDEEEQRDTLERCKTGSGPLLMPL